MTCNPPPCLGGLGAIGAGLFTHIDHTLDVLHIPDPIVDHIVHHGEHPGGPITHHAGKGLGIGSFQPLDFTNIPLTPMAHVATTSSGVTLNLITLVGIAAVALVLMSMMVRSVVVACSH